MPTLDLVLVVALALTGFAALFQGARVKLRLPMVWLSSSIAVWVAAGSLQTPDGPPNYVALALLFFGVSMTAGAAYVLMRKLLENDVATPVPHLVLMCVFPVAIAAVTILGIGIPELSEWRTSPTYIVQAIYIYGHFGAMLLVMAKRQLDPSLRIRAALIATGSLVLVALIVETVAYHNTHYAVVFLGFLAAWAARWPASWWQAPVAADELLESIGVFLFVVDDQGRLRKWNSTAAKLVSAIAPRTSLQRGVYIEKVLGVDLPRTDGAIVEFVLGGGVLRTECQTHEVPMGPGQSTSERVLMLRPLKSRVTSSSLTSPSGALAGYDPVTQTLSRRSILDKLEAADAGIRLEFRPTIRGVLVDEVMFVVARRLESASGSVEWGRLDAWNFAAASHTAADADLLADSLLSIDGQPIDYGLAVFSKASVFVRQPHESGDAFATRLSGPSASDDGDNFESHKVKADR